MSNRLPEDSNRRFHRIYHNQTVMLLKAPAAKRLAQACSRKTLVSAPKAATTETEINKWLEPAVLYDAKTG